MAYGQNRQPGGWFTGFMGGAGRLLRGFGKGMKKRGSYAGPKYPTGSASGYPKGQKPSWAASDTPPMVPGSTPHYPVGPYKPVKSFMHRNKGKIAAGTAVAGAAGTAGYMMTRDGSGGGGGSTPGQNYGPQPRPGTKYTPVQKVDGSGMGPSNEAGKKDKRPIAPRKTPARKGTGRAMGKKAPARKGTGRAMGKKAPAVQGGDGKDKGWFKGLSRGRQNSLLLGAGFAAGFVGGRLSKRRSKANTVYSGSYVRNYYYR